MDSNADCGICNCRLKFISFWNHWWVFVHVNGCVYVRFKLEGFIYFFSFAFHIENKKRPFGLEAKTPSCILHCLTQSPYCIFPFFFLINTYKTILLEVAIQLKYLWKAYLPWVPMFPCSFLHFFFFFSCNVVFSPSYNLFYICRKIILLKAVFNFIYYGVAY